MIYNMKQEKVFLIVRLDLHIDVTIRLLKFLKEKKKMCKLIENLFKLEPNHQIVLIRRL